jgi:predicted lysophospholipase L1 biosynthesis ABC-type transport system permease subunit
MDACSASGSPAFSLIAGSALTLFVSLARDWPVLRSLSAVVYYSCAAVAAAVAGWLLSKEMCDPQFSTNARLWLVGVNTLIVVSVAAIWTYLRRRQSGGKR